MDAPKPAPVPGWELRLALDEAAADRLKRDAAGLLAPLRRPVARRLRQTFWDTPDHRIGRAGLALARQAAGARQTQLLCEIRRPPAGGRQAHSQGSALVADTFDLSRLAFMPGADPGLVPEIAAAALVPAFALELALTTWRVPEDGAEIAVTLERATIEAAAGEAAAIQLRLALVAGPPDAVYALARRLAPALGFVLAGHDPVQLGYRLVTGEDWWSDAGSGAADLRPGMTVRQGVLAIGRAAAADFRSRMAPLAGSVAPETIHQARVAIRRLRSMLSVFRRALPPAAGTLLSARLRDLAACLGHVREWDVLAEGTLMALDAALGEDSALRGLVATASRRRAEAADALRAVVGGETIMTLSLELGSWFDAGLWPAPETPDEARTLGEPLGAFAAAILKRRHRKLTGTGAALGDAAAAQFHALRIEAKKLRYTIDFLRPLYSEKRVRRYVSSLKAIQDVLGAAQDAATSLTLVPDLDRAADPDAARAAGLVAGWTAAQGSAARAGFAEAWKAFLKAERFWKG